ncbi:MAG TPA: hypothetical protein VGE72_14745 [Azospirillum sp.]
MRRGSRSTFRTVVVSLLMLATLLVYAVPGHAGPMPHHSTPAPQEHAHQHALADAHDHAVTAVVDHAHEPEPCGDLALLDGDMCCSVGQCATMHGGLPAGSTAAVVPRRDRTAHPAALATPEGVGRDPALRPPCLTV